MCSVLITAASCSAQNKAPAPFVNTNTDISDVTDVTDAREILDIIGSDADARAVIAQVLADVSNRRGTVVLASQIRQEWLPVMEGVDIVRLADRDIRPFLSGCGRYRIITNVERTENVVWLRLEMKCGCTFSDYTASFDGHIWQVRMNGQACGCGGPQPPDCPCFGR
jgi:hypothetical protein